MSERLPISEIWVYLSGDPLVNPVAISVMLTSIVIYMLDMPYEKYFEGAQFVHFYCGRQPLP